MAKKKQPKTSGYQWVEFSVIAFNGSGYADRLSAEKFLQSYIDYKRWKNQPEAVKLAYDFSEPLLVLCEHLRQGEVTKQPSPKNWAKFQARRGNIKLL